MKSRQHLALLLTLTGAVIHATSACSPRFQPAAAAANDVGQAELRLVGTDEVSLTVGEELQLFVAPVDASGTTFTGLYTVAWSTSSPAVATVTAAGVVAGQATGTATITATAHIISTDERLTASTTVSVGDGTSPPAPGTPLFRAINFNGQSITIGDVTYEPGTGSNLTVGNSSAFEDYSIPLNPVTDEDTAQLVRSSIYSDSLDVRLTQVPNGTYDVFFFVWEDNNSETIDVMLQGEVVLDDYDTGSAGTWMKAGPYRAAVTDQTLQLESAGGTMNLSALEVYTVSTSTPGTPGPGPDPVCAEAGAFGGRVFTTLDQPLRITAGGIYENLIVTSPDSDTAAIEVDTDEPVVIQYVRGSGPGNFVHAGGNSDVTIMHSVYQATTQTRDGVRRGKFYAAYQPRNVVVEHCELDHTSGIQVQMFAGDGSPAQTVRVRYNDAREIDGRFRNGGSEFQNFVAVQAGNRASAEIAYNRVVTTPGQGRTEDNITMYKNGGTADRPFIVYRNYVEGTYTDDYTQVPTTGTAMNCDGDNLTTDDDMPQYGLWQENTATGGAAINMAVGRHMRANRNTVVSVGRNRFGVRYRSGYAGISIFNYIGTSLMIDNGGEGNRIMWLRDEAGVDDGTPYSTTRADVDQGADQLTGTVALELEPAVAEQQAYDDWVTLIASAGVTVGPNWCQ